MIQTITSLIQKCSNTEGIYVLNLFVDGKIITSLVVSKFDVVFGLLT